MRSTPRKLEPDACHSVTFPHLRGAGIRFTTRGQRVRIDGGVVGVVN
jgi:hypothetical protein